MENKTPRYCPNCLSDKTEIVLDHSHFDSKKRLRWYGFCYNCGNKGELRNSFNEALRKWDSQTEYIDKVDDNTFYNHFTGDNESIESTHSEEYLKKRSLSCVDYEICKFLTQNKDLICDLDCASYKNRKVTPKINHNPKRAILQYLLCLSGQKINKKDSTNRLFKKLENLKNTDFEKLERKLLT
ncbi:MAG TPA: hypothetical protein VGB37_05190 [Candidatus Lokiarchaeia archaeon]